MSLFQISAPQKVQVLHAPGARRVVRTRLGSNAVSPLIRRFLDRESALRSDSEDEDVALCRLRRKQRRKWRRGGPGGREERPVIQGLWVHEVDWLKSGESSSDLIPPPPQFTDWQPCGDEDAGCSCTDVCECTGQSGDTDDCDLDQDSESESNSSRGGEDNASVNADLTFDPMQVSSSPDVRWSDSAGSLQSLLGDSHSAPSDVNKSQGAFGASEPNRPDVFVEVLRGRVTQMTKASTSPLSRNLIKGTLREWRGSEHLHEGLIFHHVRHRNSPSSPVALVLLSFPAFSFVPCCS